MWGHVRRARVGVVVLIALAASISAGALGLGAGHALPLGSEHNWSASGRMGGAEPPLARSAAIPSAGPLLNAAAIASPVIELSSRNVQASGFFGTAVAVSGTTVVVGAPDENASGHLNSGHVYIFNSKTGAATLTLTSPHPQHNGEFGLSVAVSGTTVVVGAPGETASGQAGAGHAYTYNATTGKLIKTFTSPNAQTAGLFGGSVAISGKTVLVGAEDETVLIFFSTFLNAGHAYTFHATTGKLIKTFRSPNPQTNGNFGHSVATTGKTMVVGALGETVSGNTTAGRAYTFSTATGQADIHAHQRPRTDPGTLWGLGRDQRHHGRGRRYGRDRLRADRGGPRVHFRRLVGKLLKTLTTPNAQYDGGFGDAVAISGQSVLVGALDESVLSQVFAGHAYTFDATKGALNLTLTSPNAQSNGVFGDSVAISGTAVVVGAAQESAFGASFGGHTYLE